MYKVCCPCYIQSLCLIWFIMSRSPFFSVMSGQVFLGWTTTKQRTKHLAQGHNAVPPVRLKPATPRSWVKYSITETVRSSYSIIMKCAENHSMFNSHKGYNRFVNSIGFLVANDHLCLTLKLFYAQVTHSWTVRQISHGHNPASFVAIRIGT